MASSDIENKPRTLILKSSDGEKFSLSESAAGLSITLKSMLEAGCTGEVPLLAVDARTLAKVVTYLRKHADSGVSDEEMKKFDEKFVSGEKMRSLLEISLAANYLEVKDLFEAVCAKMADIIKNKSVAWVRKMFNIENDFTPEEEDAIKQQHAWAHEDVDPFEDDDDDDE